MDNSNQRDRIDLPVTWCSADEFEIVAESEDQAIEIALATVRRLEGVEVMT